MINHCELCGVIQTTPLLKKTPNGFFHCQFHLSHLSEQIEAGLKREVKCRIPVVYSDTKEITYNFTRGSKIKVVGFLNLHTMRNETQKLVLHANQIELIS